MSTWTCSRHGVSLAQCCLMSHELTATPAPASTEETKECSTCKGSGEVPRHHPAPRDVAQHSLGVPLGRQEGHGMSAKPRALDLFCGAGGVTRGLQLAGFEVTGVDLVASPRYVGDAFIQGDALTVPLDGFDFIWASPPRQAFTAYKRRTGHVRQRPNLIPAIRGRLSTQPAPWCIENVGGAPLDRPVMLCGSMFGLDVRRHRFFESPLSLSQPACRHDLQTPRFACATNRTNLRSTVEVGVYRIPLAVQQKAMGIDWMRLGELSQAIPPAYAEFIGRQALRTIALRMCLEELRQCEGVCFDNAGCYAEPDKVHAADCSWLVAIEAARKALEGTK